MTDVSTQKPRVSIIVPVYHVENYLERCIDSILNQAFSDFELIIVNDGGTERETSMCEQYAERDARIVYIYQQNAGLSAARNAGLDICQGTWIMFVDSDDWVHPDFCAKALECVESTGASLAIFDLAYTKGNDTEGRIHRSKLPEGCYDSLTVLKARLCSYVTGYAWNKIYHRSLWETIRFPVGECWEDDGVMDMVIDSASTIAIIHDVLYYKPARYDSITGIAYVKAEDSKWLYIQRRKRYYFLKEHHPELLGIVQDNMAMTAMLYGIYRLNYSPDEKEFEQSREWAQREKLSLDNEKPHTRFAYFAFLHCKPLFRVAALLWTRKRAKRAQGKTKNYR